MGITRSTAFLYFLKGVITMMSQNIIAEYATEIAIAYYLNTFRTYINRVSFPDVDNLKKIAYYLNVSL